MKVSAGNIGQIFFEPAGGVFSEANSLGLDPTDTIGEVVVDTVLLP